MSTLEKKEQVVIKFAGDSGDGMQLTGGQFTTNTALTGSDLATFPDFPAEIRAPQGTVAGVSGFQIHFGSKNIYTPGDSLDVLVAMNAAALKSNLAHIKDNGVIITDNLGFDKKNLRLAGYPVGVNPLEEDNIEPFNVYTVEITKLTREALKDSGLGSKDKDRCKNMFVLGFLYWMYGRNLDNTIQFLNGKFAKKPEILTANIKALKAGFFYGDTTETFTTKYEVEPAKMDQGTYRSIGGNTALAYGLITAGQKSKLPLFLGTYPITPASDILHELAKHKNFGVKTFQAEDEIAAICSSIGASFAGNLGITTSSGPGIALKGEAIGLATILEIPLVVVNVQRGGPSTGLPTKTEQSDLMQALYGRNGEAPVPVIATKTPSDCFFAAIEAARIAIEYMTPVLLLSDGYIANGAEPWKFPKAAEIEEIKVSFAKGEKNEEGNWKDYLPYKRDEKLVRPWAIPGTAGLEHRIGGLEKEIDTGNVSYDPENHEKMTKLRAEKVAKIADSIPAQHIDQGPAKGKLLILGWGSTYGSIKGSVKELNEEGYDIAHAHLRYLNPFPKNLGDILANYETVLIPELNDGQLVTVIRDKFLIDAKRYNKIKGLPIYKDELKAEILKHL
jgi:2-oxoglutarate/2-oxoacid ferredoxin oxidoreductase subunit alpha